MTPGHASSNSSRAFEDLVKDVIACGKCPRLRAYAKAVADEKPTRFADWDFWARPVPGFGDLGARLLIVGLAPARTGALRTGRIFTGDASSRFLVTALYRTGFTNQPVSETREDGLVYTDSFITAALKCAPPGDKPLPEELTNCYPYLDEEIAILSNLQAVLVLGSLAFKAYFNHLKRGRMSFVTPKFVHGGVYRFQGSPTVYASYHPSPRNTNTGKLTQGMLVSVLNRIRRDLG